MEQGTRASICFPFAVTMPTFFISGGQGGVPLFPHRLIPEAPDLLGDLGRRTLVRNIELLGGMSMGAGCPLRCVVLDDFAAPGLVQLVFSGARVPARFRAAASAHESDAERNETVAQLL